MSYYNKGHQHKPMKGKGSYNRTDTCLTDPREIEEAWYEDELGDQELADKFEQEDEDAL